MAKVVDITGNVYGRWTVLERFDAERWTCRCQCGTIRPVAAWSLKCGDTKSCGCYRKDVAPYIQRTHGESRGGGATREYRVWKNMNRRCHTPCGKSYPVYGGRGISVCEAWRRSYETFRADMGPCPDGYSLDRINNDGNYDPSNCRWATKQQQSWNTSQNVRLTLRGQTMSASEWGHELGLSNKLIRGRKRLGWSDERALTEPLRHR